MSQPTSQEDGTDVPKTDPNKAPRKMMETCVLCGKVWRSAELASSRRHATDAKLNILFGRLMTCAAEHFGGHLVGIIGDRLMTIFDRENCHKNAVNTAAFMNSASKYIADRHFNHSEFSFSMGIDHGEVICTQIGAIQQAAEVFDHQRSLWTGRPIKVASRLSDLGNNSIQARQESQVRVGFYQPSTREWSWLEQDISDFVDDLDNSMLSNTLVHKNRNYRAHYRTACSLIESNTTPPILMTNEVLIGFKKQWRDDDIEKIGRISKTAARCLEYDGDIYGADIAVAEFNG